MSKAAKTPTFDYPRTPTDAKLRITMPDRTVYDVPVQLIADSRDENYADEQEDTVGYIRKGSLSDYELTDWAANNMNWEDVEHAAVKVETPPLLPTDFQEGWTNGKKMIVGDI